MSRRWTFPATIAVVVLAVLAVPGSAQTSGPGPGFVTLNARADTVGVEFFDPSFPAIPDGQVVFFTPASASATLDTVIGGSSFAGSPYGGETATTLPGTVNGLAAGGLPPLPPTLPGYVASSSSSDPEPPSQALGPYEVRASSSAQHADASASFGLATDDPGVLAAVATTEVRVGEDGPVALAEATILPVGIGDLLRIGEVSATASARVLPDGTTELASDLAIGRTTLAGVSIGFTSQGLQVADTLLPGTSVDVLADLLASEEVEVEYVPERRTDTSVTSAGLIVRVHQDVPTQGPTRTSFVLGQVTASAAARSGIGASLPSGPLEIPTTIPAPTASATPVAPVAPAPEPPSPPEPSPAAPAPPVATGPSTSAAPGVDVGVGPPAVAGPPAEGVLDVVPATLRIEPELGADAMGLYLVFLVAGLAIAGAGAAVSRFGNRAGANREEIVS